MTLKQRKKQIWLSTIEKESSITTARQLRHEKKTDSSGKPVNEHVDLKFIELN